MVRVISVYQTISGPLMSVSAVKVSLCQHCSGQLVLVNTVKVNHFGQPNNAISPTRPTCPNSRSSCEGRSHLQGERSFGLVMSFCQLTKGQLIRLRLRHSVNMVVVK